MQSDSWSTQLDSSVSLSLSPHQQTSPPPSLAPLPIFLSDTLLFLRACSIYHWRRTSERRSTLLLSTELPLLACSSCRIDYNTMNIIFLCKRIETFILIKINPHFMWKTLHYYSIGIVFALSKY